MGRTQPFIPYLLIVLLGAVLAARCSDSPTGPSKPPTIDPPRITCPAAQTTQSADGQSVAVNFPAPTLVGGYSPVMLTCAPASGTRFPVGSSSVVCTATDLQQRSDSCTFAVTVQPPPIDARLSATRFMAFGDSITEGKVGSSSVSRAVLLGCPGQEQPTSYTSRLRAMLPLSYPGQASAFEVVNCGVGGETAADGKTRLPSALATYAPQVLLLMQGANDLIQNPRDSAIPTLANDLTIMVREARSNSVVVFLATLLPQRTTGCGCGVPFRAEAATFVQPANDQIRTVAASERAILVDLYQAFGGTPDPALIDLDGLHPTPAGHLKIADAFFASIRSQLEISRTTSAMRVGR